MNLIAHLVKVASAAGTRAWLRIVLAGVNAV
jgi:hypothetical protein